MWTREMREWKRQPVFCSIDWTIHTKNHSALPVHSSLGCLSDALISFTCFLPSFLSSFCTVALLNAVTCLCTFSSLSRTCSRTCTVLSPPPSLLATASVVTALEQSSRVVLGNSKCRYSASSLSFFVLLYLATCLLKRNKRQRKRMKSLSVETGLLFSTLIRN